MNKTTELRLQIFTAPAAADNTSIHAAITLPSTGTTVVTTSITNPTNPRTIRLKGNQSTTQGLVVILAGTDTLDASITESVTMGGDYTVPTDSVNAFKTVTSITVPTRGGASDTISVGKGAALGLDAYCDTNSFNPLGDIAKRIRQQVFTAPAAANNTGVHAAITLPDTGTTAVTTGITNPDVPRVARIKGSASGITGNVVIVGTDILGNAITDTIASSGSSAVDGVKAFKTITSITVPTKVNSSGDTISVGFGAALGLDSICDAYSFTGFAGETSYTYNATDISQNVVTPTASLDGSTSIALVYIPSLNPQNSSVLKYTYNTSTISLNTVNLRVILDGATDQSIIYAPATFSTGRIWG